MRRPLHRLEEKLLITLRGVKRTSLEEASEKAGLSLDQTRRAVEWLRSKGLLAQEVTEKPQVELDSEGIRAKSEGLPERRLLDMLERLGGLASLEALREASSEDVALSATPSSFSAALGHARTKGWIETFTHKGKASARLSLRAGPSLEESLLDRLSHGPLSVEELSSEEGAALRRLEARPDLIRRGSLKRVLIGLTEGGLSVARSLRAREEIDTLTPELLASGKWRDYSLRPIDVESPVPFVTAGRRHPLRELIDEVREIFVALGFEEAEGPLVQPSFWNFDALFIPQDHPAREMQDTFYLSGHRAENFSGEERMPAIGEVHKSGGDTGSRGWGYEWKEDEARRLVLRTHTTAVTVRYLYDHKVSDAKIFSVGNVFRNEKMTYKNLIEFHQIEGIAVGRRVTLRDMMGLLSTFYSRLGMERVKFWPTYFPYTEPSLQSMVYFEQLGRWVELCGMGIFRPEVTLPLGVKNPVLAWGGGLERLLMIRLGLKDIREIYENSLGWLRSLPLCR